jgi:hypothetical protein
MNKPISPEAPGPLMPALVWLVLASVSAYPLIHSSKGSVSGLLRLSKYPYIISLVDSVETCVRTEEHGLILRDVDRPGELTSARIAELRRLFADSESGFNDCLIC